MVSPAPLPLKGTAPRRSEQRMTDMSTRFRPPLFIRLGNAVMSFLLRRGVSMGTNTLLTVPGRKSGVPRTTPITIIEHGGRRFVQSPFGEVDWVRNLRAAGSATLTRGRHVETVMAAELTPEETAPILQAALKLAPSMIRAYYDVAPDAPPADFVREARRHPCFELLTASAVAQAGVTTSR
jgi:deazaflavin-dependent oxidoreductase (nitroreductase family)